MTLDEAIKHAEGVAKKNEEECKNWTYGANRINNDESRKKQYLKHAEMWQECAKEHRQLAEWLKDYKRLLEQQPCEDCISRQAVLDCFKKWQPYMATRLLDFEKELSELPPVTSQACDDAVSRAEVLKLMKDNWRTHDGDWAMQESIDDIRAMISVIPETKIGRWEWVPHDSNPIIGNWHCSECGTIILHMPKKIDRTPIYKWCPICGAKMINPQESEG